MSAREADRGRVAETAREVLAAEVKGIRALEPLLTGQTFHEAVSRILECRGRVLVAGLGKSGLAGTRIAASLRSAGCPAVFLHPVEALHGDLGIVDAADIALLISKSGENHEITALARILRHRGVAMIGITAGRDSTLARGVDIALVFENAEDAGPLPEIPTVSTTVVQVIGDALVVALCREKGLTAEDFAFLHPGGMLGRKVGLRVKDVMHSGDELPCVPADCRLVDALVEIMNKRLGMTTVVDARGCLAGVLTDGDFKRILLAHGANVQDLRVSQVMSADPRTIDREELLATALKAMETNLPGAITSLVIVDEARRPEGVIHIHDILRS